MDEWALNGPARERPAGREEAQPEGSAAETPPEESAPRPGTEPEPPAEPEEPAATEPEVPEAEQPEPPEAEQPEPPEAEQPEPPEAEQPEPPAAEPETPPVAEAEQAAPEPEEPAAIEPEEPAPVEPEAPAEAEAPPELPPAAKAEEVAPEPETPQPEPETPAEVEEAPAVPEISPAAQAEPSAELAAAVDEAFEGVEEEEVPAWVPGDWFVVHTYAGYENKVKANLESRITSMNMEDKIFEVVIPMEDVMEIKGGKKQVVQRKVFPGYLLVRMELDDDSWYVVRNTPGVTGFVGSGSKPIPLSTKEVDRILQRKGVEEKVRPRLEFQAGDGVRVTMGPFANFQGVISEIDADRSKLKVLVNIFGRETPVELGFDQVAKL